MKRTTIVALVVVLAFAVAACAKTVAPEPVEGSATGNVAPTKVDPYAAIPADGAHEKAAVAALPEALKYVEKTTKEQGRELTDVSAGTPKLISYTLEAQVGKRSCLFEVRGDGKAYELYRYPDTPDPGKLFWQDTTVTSGAQLATPVGTGETAAAAAVRKVVEEAVAGEEIKVSVYGYNFYWIKPDGTPVKTSGGSPVTLSIDPLGAAGSWSM